MRRVGGVTSRGIIPPMRRTEGDGFTGDDGEDTLGAGIGGLATQFGGDADPSRADATIAAHEASRGPRSEPGAALERGALVGRYVVLSHLGAGGMGVVYAAYDPELDRKVALKLLHAAVGPGTAASLGRTRLLREAQALAKLSHPHVVAIHDVGTIDDRVWLAMEYVDGVTFGVWIARQRPRWAEALAVMRSVGEGLAAAHAAGLVHRDLKPDNIMVGRDGRVRVMDFGLARAAGNFEPEPAPVHPTDPSAGLGVLTLPVTQVGAVMGTPAYMSPEQWRGEPADARADQFSFCVTLWEAVYGVRPFVGDTMTNLVAAVLAGEPRAPPRGTKVPSWLRRTLLRGLQTEPEGRFPSIDALLVALVEGAARKRRARLAFAVGLVAAAITAVPVTLHYQRGQRIAACEAAGAEIAAVWNDAAKQSLEQALITSGLGYATTTLAKTTPWIDGWAAAWSTTRAQVCREAEVLHTRTPELYASATACLEERRDEFAALLGVLREGGADAVQRAVPAAANLTPPSSCTDRAALERRAPLPDDPELRAAVMALRAETMRVQGLSQTGRIQDGLTIAEGLLTRAEALGHDPLTVRIRLRVGELAEKRGKLDLAERSLIRAFVDAGAIGADEIAAAAAIQLVYLTGHSQAKFEPAIQWSHAAELLVRRLDKTDDLLGARLNNALAVTHKDHGDYDAAQVLYERIITIRERILGPEHPDVGMAIGNLANLLAARGASDEPLALYQRSLVVLESAYGSDHPTVAQALNNLGGALLQRGRMDEGLPLHQRALAIREKAYGPNHAEVALSLLNLAVIRYESDDLEGARTLTERALAIRETVYGPDHPLVAEALNNLSAMRLRQKALEEARTLAERALAIYERVRGPEHLEVASSLFNLAEVERERGELEQAQALFERVLAIREKDLVADSPELAEARVMLAEVHGLRGDAARARPLIDLALAVVDKGPDSDGLAAAVTLRVAAETRRRQSEFTEAQALFERALAIYAAKRGPDHPASCPTLVGLGRLALDRGRPDEATPRFERAVALCPDDPAARAGFEQARRAAKPR